MSSLKWPTLLTLAAAALGVAQPALTPIEDTLYRADGTRFTGTLFITYASFLSGGGNNVATSNLTLPIVNGVLKVQLVPTTTATAGAQYNVRYSSRGINQFTEVWAVPPSTVTLRIRDVRVSQGAMVGPPPIVSPVQIPDVVGLANELSLRPLKGVGFGLGRTAVINQSGQLDAAVGRLSDCVRVDGTSGACGGAGGGGVLPIFTDGELPSGAINGTNTVFTLQFPPSPAGSLLLYKNGLLQRNGIDFILSQANLTFLSGSVPLNGDSLVAFYRYASPNNPLGTLASTQVVCSSVGATVSATVSTRLGTCTVPAGLMETGDRLDIRFSYVHTGTASGFTGQVLIGGTTVILRTGGSSESLLNGHVDFAAGTEGQAWNSQSWGSALAFVTGAGQGSEDITQNLTVDFRGQLGTTSPDTISLLNFTVIRYPAQSNP